MADNNRKTISKKKGIVDMIYTSYAPLRCGIVLAAGDGKRLQPFVRQLRGSDLPKQYVSFTGTRSMLEHTFDRVGKVIPSDRLFSRGEPGPPLPNALRHQTQRSDLFTATSRSTHAEVSFAPREDLSLGPGLAAS